MTDYNDPFDRDHVCTDACDPANRWPDLSPRPASAHQDCAHTEFDLLENCRICGRHRSLCEA